MVRYPMVILLLYNTKNMDQSPFPLKFLYIDLNGP